MLAPRRSKDTDRAMLIVRALQVIATIARAIPEWIRLLSS